MRSSAFRPRPAGAAPRRTSSRPETGAAAVEFALISTILFVIVFGILQYGLYFNDSMSARQGVREGARMGVVRNFPACGTAATDMDKLRCETKRLIAAPTGTEYVRVVKPTTWVRGAPLTVCALVRSEGGIGMLPMPDGGWISTKTQMSIEQARTPLPTGATSADTLPAGQSWDWCT